MFQKIDSTWNEHANHFHDTLANSYISDGIATESIISLAHEDALTTSIKRRVAESVALSIWPNPASTEVNIDLGDSFRKGQYVILRNINGQVVRMADVRTQTFKIKRKGLSSGIYFLELREASYSLGIEKITWE